MSCILEVLKCHLLLGKRERNNSQTLMQTSSSIILSINLLCRYNLNLNITRCHDTIAIVELNTVSCRTGSCYPVNICIKQTNVSRVTIDNECHIFHLSIVSNINDDTVDSKLQHLLNILGRKSCCNRCGVAVKYSVCNETVKTKHINFNTIIEIIHLIKPGQNL